MGGETKTTTDFKLPDWQENYLKGMSSYGSDMMSQPVTPYGGPMTAPLSALSGEAADVYRRMGEAPDIAGRTAANFAAMKEAVLDPQVAAMARQRAQEMYLRNYKCRSFYGRSHCIRHVPLRQHPVGQYN